jgi:hypothetical protein
VASLARSAPAPSGGVAAPNLHARKARMHTIEDVFMEVYGPHDRPVKDRVVSTHVRVNCSRHGPCHFGSLRSQPEHLAKWLPFWSISTKC